jgi:hypothetical protein
MRGFWMAETFCRALAHCGGLYEITSPTMQWKMEYHLVNQFSTTAQGSLKKF